MSDLTIIIPAYKAFRFISECVKSIKQSAKGYEVQILIGVDGCRFTREYIMKNDFKGCEVYWFELNAGPYAVKNNILQYAKSDNILFFDADDIMCETMVKETIEGLAKSNLVSFDYVQFNEGSKDFVYKTDAHGCFACKKSLFELYGYFETWRCAADTDFRSMLDFNGVKAEKVSLPMFKRRLHNTNLTKSMTYGMHKPQRLEYWERTRKKIEAKKFPKVEIVEKLHSKILVNCLLPFILLTLLFI